MDLSEMWFSAVVFVCVWYLYGEVDVDMVERQKLDGGVCLSQPVNWVTCTECCN